MTERRKRRFMAGLVGRLLKGGRGLSEVATELGLSPGQLGACRNEHSAAGSAEALAQREAEHRRPSRGVQRLKREDRRLEQENEILERAAAFMRWPAPLSVALG